MVEIEAKYWAVIEDGKGELLFGIRDDGSVEYGPHYTPEGAKAAWKATYGSSGTAYGLRGVMGFPEVVDQQKHTEQSENENDGHDTSPTTDGAC
jgi:hypothetical protein